MSERTEMNRRIADAAAQDEREAAQDGHAPLWVRVCDHHGCVITIPHTHGVKA